MAKTKTKTVTVTLRRSSREHIDSESLRGMLAKVAHLVEVDEK
jgi:ribosomal protein L30/L7E